MHLEHSGCLMSRDIESLPSAGVIIYNWCLIPPKWLGVFSFPRSKIKFPYFFFYTCSLYAIFECQILRTTSGGITVIGNGISLIHQNIFFSLHYNLLVQNSRYVVPCECKGTGRQVKTILNSVNGFREFLSLKTFSDNKWN